MSTDQQQYSITNQHDWIAKYAAQHGFEIVHSYSDAGRSGLTLRERRGLRQLLTDISSGNHRFKAVLVYDVSRWGRFQDSDEAAHYEFLCKSAGVPVIYCAEEFANDGTIPSAMFKALKRTMAGEYSRELSVRMAACKRRFASMGFRQGGEAGYGLRRLQVSPEGVPRRLLTTNERKSFVNDRVVLVHGPKKEVAQVRRIFKIFLDGCGSIGPTHIAERLNHEKVPFLGGKRWSNQVVADLLRNPKYAGANVWGRTTTLLHTQIRYKSKQEWTIVPGAFKPIVDEETFNKAQRFLKIRAEGRIRSEMLLRELKRILRKRGRLCKEYFGHKNNTYAECTYYRAFGGFKNAYELAGFKYDPVIFSRRESGIATEMIRNRLIKELIQIFPQELIDFRLPHAVRRTSLLLDGKFKLFVWIAKSYVTPLGKVGWTLAPRVNEEDGITVICTLGTGNRQFQDFFVFPGLHLNRTQYKFGPDDPLLARGVKLRDLSELCKVARQVLVNSAIPVPALDITNCRTSTLDDQLAGRLQPDGQRTSSERARLKEAKRKIKERCRKQSA